MNTTKQKSCKNCNWFILEDEPIGIGYCTENGKFKSYNDVCDKWCNDLEEDEDENNI